MRISSITEGDSTPIEQPEASLKFCPSRPELLSMQEGEGKSWKHSQDSWSPTYINYGNSTMDGGFPTDGGLTTTTSPKQEASVDTCKDNNMRIEEERSTTCQAEAAASSSDLSEQQHQRISRGDRVTSPSSSKKVRGSSSNGDYPYAAATRPGAYKKAPGQQLLRNQTVEYETALISLSPQAATKDSVSSNSNNRSVHDDMTTACPFPTLVATESGTVDAAAGRKTTTTATTRTSPSYLRESLERRNQAVGLTMTMPSKRSSTVFLPSVMEDSKPEDVSGNNNEAYHHQQFSKVPSATTDDDTLQKQICATTTTKFEASEKHLLDSDSNENRYNNESSMSLQLQHLQDPSTSSLPIAAELVRSTNEALEGEIRAKISKELEESCEIAELVEPEENRAGKRCLSATLCSLVVIIVAVWVSFACKILNGDYLSEQHSRSSSSSLRQQVGGQDEPPSSFQNNDNPLDDDLDSMILADIPKTICHEQVPLMGWSEQCGPQPHGSSVGTLIGYARLQAIPNADISILSAGEIGNDMAKGNFTRAMAKAVLPRRSLNNNNNNNTLVTLQLEGYQIARALELALEQIFLEAKLQEAQFVDDRGSDGSNNSKDLRLAGSSYPYAAGLRWDVNMTKPFPHRLSNLQVLNKPDPQNSSRDTAASPESSSLLWEPLALQGVLYNVVTSTYLASGGDGYYEFSEVPPIKTHNTTALEQFEAFCKGQGTILAPTKDYFSTQSYIQDPNLVY